MRCSIRSALCFALLALTACGEESTAPAPPDLPGDPAALSLATDAVTFTALGQTERLSATVTDASGIALGNVAVTWSTADEAVATVDASGRIEAVGPGETEVTASAGDASDAAAVVVTQAATAILISPALNELHALGDSTQYTATVRDANGNVIPDAVVDWSSGDEAVATVDAAGWVTAQANGSAVLTATAGDVSDEAAVVVEQVAASVEVTPAADSVGEGQTIALAAAVADANGAAIPDATVTWTTSDAAAATVDGGGNVTGVGRGADVTITATAAGVSGAADVRVLDQLAFAKRHDGTYEIYVMNADGSGQTAITAEDGNDRKPVWSPDGTQIAFDSKRDGDFEILVMNADGSGVIPLTDNGAGDFVPTWSPDGARIVFQSNRATGDELFIMNADGSAQTNITNDGLADRTPAWRPRP